MEYCTPVSGGDQRRGACIPRAFPDHLSRICTLKLTGKQVLGVGDASGMFPIDPATGQYDAEMLDKFEEMMVPKGYPWKLRDLLPEVLSAGDEAGTLTEEGAKLLDERAAIWKLAFRCARRRGDAGTSMTATNSVASAPVTYLPEPPYLQWLFWKRLWRRFTRRLTW